jgi:hypothetical protein
VTVPHKEPTQPSARSLAPEPGMGQGGQRDCRPARNSLTEKAAPHATSNGHAQAQENGTRPAASRNRTGLLYNYICTFC